MGEGLSGSGSLWAVCAAWVALLLMGVVSELFRRRQQAGANGGAMSRAKQVWLGFAVYTWFVLAPLLVLDPSLPSAHRWVLGAFCAAMLVRGPVELFMLYVSKNWRPPYGIAHSAFCALVILVAALGFGPGLASAEGGLAAATTWFIVVVALSLLTEVWHAWAFFRVVGERTTGDQAVWFAPKDHPAFALIVKRTAVLNVFFVSSVLVFLVRYTGVGS